MSSTKIVFTVSSHLRVHKGEDMSVQTVTAKWESGDDSHAVAHNFPTHVDAQRALTTYRYAAHQQG